MTQIITSDKITRQRAIPFRPNWYDNSIRGNLFGDRLGDTTGDLAAIATRSPTVSGINLIRYIRPNKGDLTEAYLTIAATTPFGSVSSLRLFMGYFAADGITATYDAADIATHHKIITGRITEITYGSQANIFLQGLNLLPLIPRRGDARYSEDGFVLGIELFIDKGTSPTDANNGWFLYMFKLDLSTQLAEKVDE